MHDKILKGVEQNSLSVLLLLYCMIGYCEKLFVNQVTVLSQKVFECAAYMSVIM